MRFVNSDCSPNCEYDFSSELGIIQLHVKRRLSHGDELFVKYGTEFLESKACLCRTCDLSSRENREQNTAFDFLLIEILGDIAVELMQESLTVVKAKTESVNVPKKRRVRGRELIEAFKEIGESPQSDSGSPIRKSDRPDSFMNAPTNKKIVVQSNRTHILNRTPTSEESTDDESDGCLNEIPCHENIESEYEIPPGQLNKFTVRASSPMMYDATLNCSLSEIVDNSSVATLLGLKNGSQATDEL